MVCLLVPTNAASVPVLVKDLCVCVCGKEASVKVSVSLVWQGLSLSESCVGGQVDRSGSINLSQLKSVLCARACRQVVSRITRCI